MRREVPSDLLALRTSIANKPEVAGGIPVAIVPPLKKATTHSILRVLLYGSTIFLSAFLLFQVELMMGKFLLPRFGGGPSVWSTSLLMFQLLLLAGYGYSAILCRRLEPKSQGVLHACFLLASGLILAYLAFGLHSPVFPRSYLTKSSTDYPVGHIALLLMASVGIQCIVLSATSPLLQHWLGRYAQGSPYRLYALSNLGSMLGLLAYPFFIERVLSLSMQAWLWIGGYVVFALLAMCCTFLAAQQNEVPSLEMAQSKHQKRKKKKDSARAQPRILWLALAGCSCTMLLATTNLICQQIAPIPLLWILPLSLYLLSFIISFDHARWYRRGLWHPLYLFWALFALRLLPNYSVLPTSGLLVVYSLTLFTVCMVCHGELARLKPSAEKLTSFYLMISAGGALGSMAVVLLAPQIFDRFWEFQIALVGCGVLLILIVLRDRNSWVHNFRYGRALLAVASLVMVTGTYFFTSQLKQAEERGEPVIARIRNFFGVKTILRAPVAIELYHAQILHGAQNTDSAVRNEPTLYYSRVTGIGILLGHLLRTSQGALRVGVVGMGAGTLAAYGRHGDYYRFYEIDPSIPELSRGINPTFTFVKSSPAQVDVILGDARIKMQEELSRGEGQDFDVLVVDAFSGDSIPVHLLTKEAMDLYLHHLRGPGSVIAIHVSSITLNLEPVVQSLARYYGLATIEIEEPEYLPAHWILLSRDRSLLTHPDLATYAHSLEDSQRLRIWTDDYSSLYETLHW